MNTEAKKERPALDKGRAIAASLNPDLEAILVGRYDGALPGFAETLIESAYGRLYAREGLDLRTRQLATVAALTVLGGQTAPQLKVNIEHTLAAGASEREILEVILQMAAYGGWPAAINGINAALEFFAEREKSAGVGLGQPVAATTAPERECRRQSRCSRQSPPG